VGQPPAISCTTLGRSAWPGRTGGARQGPAGCCRYLWWPVCWPAPFWTAGLVVWLMSCRLVLVPGCRLAYAGAAAAGQACRRGGGERWCRCPRRVTRTAGAGVVTSRGRPGGFAGGRCGGSRGGAGGCGHAGGAPKPAVLGASNSARSHCGSVQISSANVAPASRVVSSPMSITLPGTHSGAARSMTDTVFL
jgi:hypothetical protein